ncbi:ubiquitin-protein ligase molybdopterin-converting factor [Schizopora paradoxa]|uniref:Ubiquitin-protein ligase molybdopterin-converting factor n=1 Tax=Schizopora paradoxa TaxID=27342 RepID=A0A0H2S4F6_9AGAM|nr:ubiquitin-protein ligase molybdopterin-converting factor [Schizopora paradoxa]
MLSGIDWRSHRVQLVGVALSTCFVTAGALSAFQTLSKRRRRKELEEEVRRAVGKLENGNASRQQPYTGDEKRRLEFSDHLIREQLARCYAVFQEDGMAKVRKARVVIVGCGGVGSWAAMMLVRSGISYIRLVDFDQVTLSSLNRHASATLADVGIPKVRSVAKALRAVSSWVEIDERQETWRLDDEGTRLLEGVDWVVDAIDNIGTKVSLLAHCHRNGIKVISSMGAGSKLDPTRIQITDIASTTEDPLSRAVRVRLRKEHRITTGITVVYSSEPPVEALKLIPLSEEERQKGDVKHLAVHDDFRVRVIPVFGPLPSIFGLHVASYIICDVAGMPIQRPLANKNRKKLYEKLMVELKTREEKLLGEPLNRIPLDEVDVIYIFEDLHRGKSIVPPYQLPNKPVLTRWNPQDPLTPENCVVFDASELAKHVEGLKQGKTGEEIWGQEVAELVARRREEAREWMKKIME